MRNENELNASLSRIWRSHERDGFLAVKVAQKYHIGVSDFFIWHKGLCAAVETKFVLTLPPRALVLKHAFQGPQLNFLRRVKQSGGAPSYGLIAVHDEKTYVVFDYNNIPEAGNWKGKDEFMTAVNVHAALFPYGRERVLLEYFFA